MVGGKDPFGFPANNVEILDGDSWKTLADLTPGDHQYSNNPTKSCIAYLQASRHKVKEVHTMIATYLVLSSPGPNPGPKRLPSQIKVK